MARTDGDCVMDVIEYLENMATSVFDAVDETQSKNELNKLYGACKLVVDCYPFQDESSYMVVSDLLIQVAEFHAATYGTTLVYDK